jgi:hypothetical protein
MLAYWNTQILGDLREEPSDRTVRGSAASTRGSHLRALCAENWNGLGPHDTAVLRPKKLTVSGLRGDA